MANYFLNNRQVIKELAINTGTTSAPVYSNLCVSTEIGVVTDLETQDFYVFCDALQRKVITGGNVKLTGTLKIDVNNDGDIALLDKVHTLINEGEVWYKGKICDAKEINAKFGWEPIALGAKEGLALLNGTQFMSSHAVYALLKAFLKTSVCSLYALGSNGFAV
jgi:hypothetical protein